MYAYKHTLVLFNHYFFSSLFFANFNYTVASCVNIQFRKRKDISHFVSESNNFEDDFTFPVYSSSPKVINSMLS